MLLRIRQLPQPQQSTFDSHKHTHAHKHGTITSTTAQRPNNHNHKCLQLSANLSHTHVHTRAVHMRRREWHKLRTKRRSCAYGTDKSDIGVFIFVCIYTAGSGSTHIEHTHPSISTLDIFIRCRHNKFRGRKNKIHIPNFPSGPLFSLACFFHSPARMGCFGSTVDPSFSFLFSKYGFCVQV